MDTHTSNSFLMYQSSDIPPAQLFIGQQSRTIQVVEEFLQNILCKNNACNTCIACTAIRTRQHHAIHWLFPEKNYTIDSLQDIFNRISFQLEPHESFFFIIQKAEFLTTLCANKLLKPMEEPPPGYHFILLAESIENIPSTIRSRCVINIITSIDKHSLSHPLYEVFTNKFLSIQQFSQLLDTTPINERETVELLDMIIAYWLSRYQQTSNNIQEQKKINSIITCFQNTLSRLPMPGSSLIFWRNIYLQFHRLI